jgi:hypothetical protein
MFTQFVNYIQKNVGTTAVTLVTCPAAQQLVVNQLSCANITGLNVTCSVTVTRAGVTVFIVNSATVPANGSLICAGDDQKIVLMAGDILRVQSSAANSIDAVVSGVLNDFNSAAVVPAPPTSPVATFAIAPNVTTIFERGFSPNNVVTYTVTTTNVPNGTVLYWENVGTTTAQDFTDDRNDGEVVINSNTGSFTRTLRSTDTVGEGSETIVMVLRFRPGFLGGGAVAAAVRVRVRDSVIPTGLIMSIDASNPDSYSGSGVNWFDITGNENHVTLQNSPTFVNGAIAFNGTNQWARTAQNLNLTAFNAVTVEIVVRTDLITGCYMTWEHTADWNTNVGGIGLSVHCNGSGGQANVHHTNHNTGPARNYESPVGTGWAVHTNVFSRTGDETGRLSYVNGQRVPFSPVNGYATGTATFGGSFANALLYFAGRGGLGQMPGQIMAFRIYNRKLTDSEIQQNYLAIADRFNPPTSSTHAFTVGQSSNRGLFSTDGVNWTETTLPSSGIWLDSNHNPASPGRACALAWGTAIWSSNFGQTWTAATGMGGGDGSVAGLAPVTSTVWITIGEGTTNYYRSTNNGQTWTLQNFGSTYNGRGVAGIGAGLAVVVTNSLTYYTTTDGSSFTTRTLPANPSGFTTGFTRIEYVNGFYIILQAQGGRFIYTSPDGVNWTVRDVGLGVNTGSMRDISFGNGLWVIVCDLTNRYFTSPDLSTWTARLMPANRRWCGVAYIDDLWVAIVDDNAAGQNIRATSTDGINWVESTLTANATRWSDLTEVR